MLLAISISLSLVMCSSAVQAPAPEQGREPRSLTLRVPAERELGQGESHSYRVVLAAGQYLRTVVEQTGLDVIIGISGPDGPMTEIDNGQLGSEQVHLIARGGGAYMIEVRAVNRLASGRYRIILEQLRDATSEDHKRVIADQGFLEARRLFLQGRVETSREAIKKYEEVVQILREIGDRQREATSLYHSGVVHHNISEPLKAISVYREALALWRELGDRRFEAQTLNAIGWSYQQMGDAQGSLQAYNEAIPLWKTLSDRRGEAQALSAAGSVHESLGDRKTALESYLRALPLARDSGDRGVETFTIGNIGALYSGLGEWEKALQYMNEALSYWRQARNKGGESGTLLQIGIVYTQLGETGQALECFEQVLEITRASGFRRDQAAALNNIANLHYARQDYQRALEYYERALTLKEETGDRLNQQHTLDNIGLTLWHLGKDTEALGQFNKAITLSRATGVPAKKALLGMGLVYAGQGDLAKGLEHFLEALRLSQAAGDRPSESVILYNIARAERDLGNLEKAGTHIEASLKIIESLRLNVKGQDLRSSYFGAGTAQGPFRFHVDLLMRMHKQNDAAGYDLAALEASERVRARSLLELLAESRAHLTKSVDPVLIARERELQHGIDEKEAVRLRLSSSNAGENQADAIKRQLDGLLAEHQRVRAEISAGSPHYAALTQPVTLSVRDIQRLLDDDTLLLQYLIGAERSYVWAVTPNGVRSFELPSQREIQAAARDLHALLAMSDKRRLRTQTELAAVKLSQMVLGPLSSLLDRKRLIIVTDDALQYIPFAALPKPATVRHGDTEARRQEIGVAASSRRPLSASYDPLILEHEIVNLPSASVLAVLRQETKGRPNATRSVAVLADPVLRRDDARVKAELDLGDKSAAQTSLHQGNKHPDKELGRSPSGTGVDHLQRLPFSRQEAEAILSLDRKLSLGALDFNASRATATSAALGEYRIVHFATHAFLDSEQPGRSGIVLSMVDQSGQPQNGFLPADEIYNLRLGAELVVLSACRTAIGKEIRGEGLISLVRAFMYAGSPRVVASLWDVRDEATAQLMKRFYREMLVAGKRPSAALRAAQISMRKEPQWKSPYYWAGFVLQGEWR